MGLFDRLRELGRGNRSFADRIRMLSLPLTGRTIRAQAEQQSEYETDVDTDIAEGQQIAGQFGPQTLGAYDPHAQQQLQILAALGPRLRGAAGDIVGGYDERYRRGMGILEGMGAQERRDINRDFGEREAGAAAFRQERGIGSTTAGTSAAARFGRERADALGGLEERLRQQRFLADMGLSAESLNARQYAAGVDESTATNLANLHGGIGMNRANLIAGGLAAPLDWLGNVNRVPPEPNPYPSFFGQNLVSPPNYG